MGRVCGVAWVVLVVSAAATAAPVPPPPKAADGDVPWSAAKLLRHRKVQKELGLSAEQRLAVVDGLEDITEEHNQKIDALLKKGDVPEDAIEKLDLQRELAAERLLRRTAAKTLTPAQRTRLRQLDRQVRGPAAFADPQVVAGLKLTDAQKKTAADLVKRLGDKTDAYLAQIGNDDSDNLKEELLKFRAEAGKALEGALSAEQREAWAALLGPPATVADPVDLWLTVTEAEEYGSAP